MSSRRFRSLAWIAVIGLGLALAPAIFQMFTRAPKGGQMMNEFKPYMKTAKLDQFDGFLDEIDAAAKETRRGLPAAVAKEKGTTAAQVLKDLPGLVAFNEQWPAIQDDMRGMLAQIRRNLGRFDAVNSLPPFPLFPYFFVLPGLMIAAVAVSALFGKGSTRSRLRLLAVFGVALIAAPAVFQMFSRAPKGADMINDFKTLMTDERVSSMQNYFLDIAGGEGPIRNTLLPVLDDAGVNVESRYPGSVALTQDWPTISGEMAPMVGAMADNLDNYAAVKALPPFWLFPWFFVLPGLIVAALAISGAREPETSGTAVAGASAGSAPPPATRESGGATAEPTKVITLEPEPTIQPATPQPTAAAGARAKRATASRTRTARPNNGRGKR